MKRQFIPAKASDCFGTQGMATFWRLDGETVRIGTGPTSMRISLRHLLCGMEQIHQEGATGIWPENGELHIRIGEHEDALDYTFPMGSVDRFVSGVLDAQADALLAGPIEVARLLYAGDLRVWWFYDTHDPYAIRMDIKSHELDGHSWTESPGEA